MVIEELFTRLGFQVDPKGIDKAKNALSGFKKWVGGLALGAGFVALAKTGVEAAMAIEGLTTDFEVMSGSAERANSLLSEIAEFAAKTPFDKIGLSGAAKTLMAFGIEAEKVMPTLKMLGDVSLGDQNKLNGLALVFGQIQSTGKLMGQDLLQLINQGFNPLTEISKKTGMSVSDLKDAMAQGAITADMVTLAFKSATSAGGLFFNGMEKKSQTLQGKLSTLKDNFVTALQNMAEAFLPIMKAGVDMLIAYDWTPIVDSVRSLANSLQQLPQMFEDVVMWGTRLLILFLVLFGQSHIKAFLVKIKEATLATKAFGTAQLIVQRAALASGAAMNYQVTVLGLLKSAFFQVKTAGVSAIKGIGLAMKTSLGPIGLALMAIEGFVEAYNWLQGKSAKAAEEKELEWGRNYFKQKFLYEGKKTPEQVLSELESNLEKERDRMTKLQATANLGGVEGRKASEQIKSSAQNVKDRERTIGILRQVYAEQYGVEWKSTSRGLVSNPKFDGNTAELEKAFANLEKEIKENTKATKSNTKAKEKPPFDITALSRQAFDAAFNVKLREITLGAI